MELEKSFLYTHLGHSVYSDVEKIDNAIDLIIESMIAYKDNELKKLSVADIINRIFKEIKFEQRIVHKNGEKVSSDFINGFDNCVGLLKTIIEQETGMKVESDEIIKEEENEEMQKLSRKGLKEIHSVACNAWKGALEHYGTRNPLEDYVELSKQEVQTMFNECTEEQLPIVSKYLKEDDLSVYFGDKAKKGEHNYEKWVAVVDFVGVVDQEKRDWLINYFQQLEDNGNMQIPTNINGIIDTE